jgi:hypothetical protein
LKSQGVFQKKTEKNQEKKGLLQTFYVLQQPLGFSLLC